MRIFENVNILENGDILIEKKTANFHHIYNVLRAKIGEILEVVDIESKTLYVTEIKDGNGNLKVKDIIRKEEDNIKITMYQGAIKGERFEYFLEKTTELGVDKICIIPLKRNVVKFKENEKNKKEERFKKILESSSKQSRRLDIPKLDILNNREMMNSLEKEDIVIVLYEQILNETIDMKTMVKTIVDNNYNNIGVIIGAEGGIDNLEIEEFKKLKNTKIVTLGNRILRAETAGVALLSILNYELRR
jgi:RNA methyltransferase, rsmE family